MSYELVGVTLLLRSSWLRISSLVRTGVIQELPRESHFNYLRKRQKANL